MKRLFVLLTVLALATLAGAQTPTHSASLTWNASTSGATGFNVYRSTTSGGCATVTATGCTKANATAITGTSFTDSPLAASTTYFWVVTAFNANGESGPSNQVTGTTKPDPAPAAPTGVTVTAQ